MDRTEQKKLLQEISRRYEDDLDVDLEEAAAFDLDDEEELDDEPAWRPVANLAPLSDVNMDRLSVSKVSSFKANYWDFQQEGSPAYKGTARVNLDRALNGGKKLSDRSAAPLLRLVKALLYYCLPGNALFVRTKSYNTVPTIANHIILIAKLLSDRGLYIDVHGNGAFATAEVLTRDDIVAWLDATENLGLKYQVLYHLVNWQKLSKEGFMPQLFCLSSELVSGEILKAAQKAWQESKDNAVGHLPISLDDLGVVVPYCIDMVERHAEDILFVHDAVTDPSAFPNEIGWKPVESERVCLAMKSRLAPNLWEPEDYRVSAGSLNTDAAQALRVEIRECPGWENTATVRNLQRLQNQELIALAQQVGVDLEQFRGGSVLIDTKALRYHYQSLVVKLRTACEILILLVTGMRRVELANLKAGHARMVPGSKDEYVLDFEVYKTSTASSGDRVTLPIPEIAFTAYRILERITAHARQASGTENLFINVLHRNYGKLRHVNNLRTQLSLFSDDLGLEEQIHPHQFRKSLAMFFIYHDARNLTLLKRLFSHKSLTMTLKYVVQIPGMSEEIRRAVIDTHMDLLLDLMEAVNTGKIGGSAGMRFKQSVEKSGFFAKLNDDGYESMRMFIETLLEHETKVLSRCRMAVVCTKMHSSIVDSAPEPCNCDIVNCDNAIFTEASINDLKEEIRFHTEVILANPKAGKDQRGFSQKRVRDCTERLSELTGSDNIASDYPDVKLGAA